jgi:hypothetical protein
MNRKVISLIGLVVLFAGCENIPGSKKQGTSESSQAGKSFIPPEPSKAITVISAAARGSMGYEGKRAHLNIKNNTSKDVVMVEFTIQYFDAQSNVLPGSPMHYVETVMPVFIKASETKEFDIPKTLPAKASRIEVAITKVSYAQ